MKDMELITRQEPGLVEFYNFEDLKTMLEAELVRYQNIAYSEDDLKEAKADQKKLKDLRKAIDDKRKEIKKIYMQPYEVVEAQTKELIALIDAPLKAIGTYLDSAQEAEKEQKRQEIRAFYDREATPLGELADALFASPSFWNPKWELKSAKAKMWQDEIREKIAQAAADLSSLQSAGGEHTPALIAKYLECQDMEQVHQFRESLTAAKEISTTVEAADEQDNVVGWQIMKIHGTRRQMQMLRDQLEIMGMEFEILEDGMPGNLEELTVPDFDSFVAFDIETSGTFGAAKGDAPSEITEIGAVKVENGKIVSRFTSLCNPGRKITPIATRVTGITDAMVLSEPPVETVIRLFAEFVGDSILVGHNIKSSDLHYITTAANRAGVAFENKFFDTYLYAKTLKEQQGWENVKLEYLSKVFGITQNEAHRAWCDAEANVGVYFKLKEL
ncbi:MAG: DUF1351 domain-containing protein [Oscillospiraceae bacterium]|nr:DUF1351 domain-containing protein [Oscillospiraceae bacterium]